MYLARTEYYRVNLNNAKWPYAFYPTLMNIRSRGCAIDLSIPCIAGLHTEKINNFLEALKLCAWPGSLVTFVPTGNTNRNIEFEWLCFVHELNAIKVNLNSMMWSYSLYPTLMHVQSFSRMGTGGIDDKIMALLSAFWDHFVLGSRCCWWLVLTKSHSRGALISLLLTRAWWLETTQCSCDIAVIPLV